jgi:proliferating cell nuclear antigen
MNDYHFKLMTVSTVAFRSCIEALNQLLVDVNLEIIPKTDTTDGSLKILAVNNNISMLVHLRLYAKNFDIFECEEKNIVGINIQNFYKLIKTLTNNDILSIYREKSSKNKNKIFIKIENEEKNQFFLYSTQILDIENDILDISTVDFTAIIIFNSHDFSKLVKDMNSLESKYVEIELNKKAITFKAVGDIANAEATLSENDSNSIVIKYNNPEDSEKIIKNKFEIKNLMLLSKCCGLCNTVEIYVKKNFPMLMKFSISNLGYLHLCVSPIMEENIEELNF